MQGFCFCFCFTFFSKRESKFIAKAYNPESSEAPSDWWACCGISKEVTMEGADVRTNLGGHLVEETGNTCSKPIFCQVPPPKTLTLFSSSNMLFLSFLHSFFLSSLFHSSFLFLPLSFPLLFLFGFLRQGFTV